MATNDDTADPAAPHMIYESDPVDSDPNTAGIYFIWDTSSNRETIYNGDPNARLEIPAMNWSNHAVEFQATIVWQSDCQTG
jgi:hypothetical protein